jgi:hypothetical protein
MLAGVSHAEAWGTFSGMIEGSDYIAQYQVHTRNGKPIGRRLVQVYWQAKGFDDAAVRKNAKPWNLQDDLALGIGPATRNPEDFDRETDGVTTTFEFYGHGQPLWTASSEKGVIFFPGSTADIGVEVEIAASDVEFHEILVAASKLKQRGAKMVGNLELSVFGKRHLAKESKP